MFIAGTLHIVEKYILNINKKMIFNFLSNVDFKDYQISVYFYENIDVRIDIKLLNIITINDVEIQLYEKKKLKNRRLDETI